MTEIRLDCVYIIDNIFSIIYIFVNQNIYYTITYWNLHAHLWLIRQSRNWSRSTLTSMTIRNAMQLRMKKWSLGQISPCVQKTGGWSNFKFDHTGLDWNTLDPKPARKYIQKSMIMLSKRLKETWPTGELNLLHKLQKMK